MLVEGQAGIVTGAAGGIGRATAIAFAREGAAVVVTDLAHQTAALDETVGLIEAAGGTVIALTADVTSTEDHRRVVNTVVGEFGGLDFAFNNAGIELQQDFLQITEREFDLVMTVNTKGVFLGMQVQLEQMARQGKGAIVNSASAAGILGLPGYAGYSASKHAVVGLTKSAAGEFAERGIRINAVAPAAIESPMLLTLSEQARADLVANQAIKRTGSPNEVADAVVWLASDRASFITGIALPVDAGLSAY